MVMVSEPSSATCGSGVRSAGSVQRLQRPTGRARQQRLQAHRPKPDVLNVMHDCFVCALPAEVQAEFTYNDEEWVTVLCADGHWVIVRHHELRELTA